MWSMGFADLEMLTLILRSAVKNNLWVYDSWGPSWYATCVIWHVKCLQLGNPAVNGCGGNGQLSPIMTHDVQLLSRLQQLSNTGTQSSVTCMTWRDMRCPWLMMFSLNRSGTHYQMALHDTTWHETSMAHDVQFKIDCNTFKNRIHYQMAFHDTTRHETSRKYISSP